MLDRLFEARRIAARRRNPRWRRSIRSWLRGRATGRFHIDTFSARFEPLEGRAVLAVNGITALDTAFNEDFNSMGSSATAALPAGFRMGTDYATGSSATTPTTGTLSVSQDAWIALAIDFRNQTTKNKR